MEGYQKSMCEILTCCLSQSWIYDCKLTELFIQQPWNYSCLTKQFIEFLQSQNFQTLNCLPLDNALPPNFPSLNTLLNTFQKLADPTAVVARTSDRCNITPHLQLGMNEKKKHEISCMAPEVARLYGQNSCNLLIDVGCGLGYLTQVLSSQYELPIVGLELSEQNCQGASRRCGRRETSLYPVVQLYIDSSEQCISQLREIIVKHAPSNETPRVCMVGLHCCADLTPAMLKVFSTMPEVQALLCLPCCYHRMQINTDGSFVNFPMSQAGKTVLQTCYNNTHHRLNSLAFRLACQETSSRWISQSEEDHIKHRNSVSYRAVLEYCCHKNNLKIVKKGKRLQTPASTSLRFGEYVEQVLGRCQILKSDGTSDELHLVPSNIVQEYLMKSYSECEPLIDKVQPYTALQVCLQPVLEHLILSDRIAFLRDQKVGVSGFLMKLFDDKISPRHLAIVASKR